MTSIMPVLSTAPTIARRLAGAASDLGVSAAAAPPALAIAEPAKTNGSSRRPSCQAGTAVLASSTAV